jgi:hypothetical protein
MDDVVLRLDGLNQTDKITLRSELPPESVTFERQPTPDGAHGEIALTIAVITLSAVALKGFVAYLVARHGMDEFEESVEIETKDGTTLKRTIRRRSSEPIAEAVVHELSTVPGVEPLLSSIS